MYNAYNRYPCQNNYYNQRNLMNHREYLYPSPYFYPMYTPEYRYRYPNQNFYNTNDYFDQMYPETDYPLSNTASNTALLNLMDYGSEPFVIDIEDATKQNDNFRTALWTGDHLQLTLMSLKPGEDIGLEMHPDVDQFIRIEDGRGIVRMGDSENDLDFEARVEDDFIFIIPAGKWHNLTNTGDEPLKLYSIYAPPNHPHGTVHRTKAESEADEH